MFHTLNELIQKYPQLLIDPEDRSKYGFCHSNLSAGYVRTGYMGATKLLHVLIMNPPEGLFVDHIDQNKLNNTRANLRIVTKSQNTINVTLRADNTSGHKGVTWNTRRSKWYARINFTRSGLRMYLDLGSFTNKEDAIKAYKAAALVYHKEYTTVV